MHSVSNSTPARKHAVVRFVASIAGSDTQKSNSQSSAKSAVSELVRKAAEFFLRCFESIEREIAFNLHWVGEDNFDGVCKNSALAAALRPGELAKSVDDHGRKIILIGTRYGTVAVFQLCCDSLSQIGKSLPDEVDCLRVIDTTGPLDSANILALLGGKDCSNIGEFLEFLEQGS